MGRVIENQNFVPRSLAPWGNSVTIQSKPANTKTPESTLGTGPEGVLIFVSVEVGTAPW